MKFAHLADCHIGGWREQELKDLSIKAFEEAINICIKENVGFILISGDLFNTALPQIDLIKDTAAILRKAREADISVYTIPGSHDFSISGKTMLDVLEKAGLLANVMKFKDDKLIFTKDKTNVKITGLLGRKGSLERFDYEKLQKQHLEKETGFKIFMFHTSLEEFKPKELEKVESQSIVNLPKNFNYYAGGHLHVKINKKYSNGLLIYPGPLFPNNFKELEELNYGGFYITDDKLNQKYIPIKLKEILTINVNANNKTPEQIEKEILLINNIKDKIITIRIEGILSSGKPSDINFKLINEKLKSAYIILKNTTKLKSKEFEELEVEAKNIDEIEDSLIKEHLSQIKLSNLSKLEEEQLAKNLMLILSKEKEEGELVKDFEIRLLKELNKILSISI